jgi:hypothetical protein
MVVVSPIDSLIIEGLNMISYDDIKEYWQHSMLRSIFWCSLQTLIIALIYPPLWWFFPALWLMAYLLEGREV